MVAKNNQIHSIDLEKLETKLPKSSAKSIKRQFKKDNIVPGTMVSISDQNLPPCKWMLSRTLEVIPGKDGM